MVPPKQAHEFYSRKLISQIRKLSFALVFINFFPLLKTNVADCNKKTDFGLLAKKIAVPIPRNVSNHRA